MTMAEQWEMLFYYLTNDCKAGDCEECSNIIGPESYLSLKDSLIFSDVVIWEEVVEEMVEEFA